jgi:hypothetical protein
VHDGDLHGDRRIEQHGDVQLQGVCVQCVLCLHIRGSTTLRRI